jgi:hypothetical protein
LSPSEFASAAYAQAVMQNQYFSAPLKLVFVECSHHSLDVYEAIKKEIKIPLSFLCLEDLNPHEPSTLQEILASC